jgi:5'-nucleotidase
MPEPTSSGRLGLLIFPPIYNCAFTYRAVRETRAAGRVAPPGRRPSAASVTLTEWASTVLSGPAPRSATGAPVEAGPLCAPVVPCPGDGVYRTGSTGRANVPERGVAWSLSRKGSPVTFEVGVVKVNTRQQGEAKEQNEAIRRDETGRAMTRVLITNDDGIDSPGLRALAEVARDRGHDTLVAAPSWDSSGASAAVTGVTQEHHLLVELRPWVDWEPGTVLAVNATPALICRSALHGRFGQAPDVVLSGINRGANTGRAILHSGTVGAALTAYNEGRPALAVSLAVIGPIGPTGSHWATAAAIAGRLFEWLTDEMRPIVLNCNVPNVPLDQMRGLRVGRLAPGGTSQTSVTEQAGGAVLVTVGAAEDVAAEDATNGPNDPMATPLRAPETDAALLEDGYACVTAVIPVTEDPNVELTTALGPSVLNLIE